MKKRKRLNMVRVTSQFVDSPYALGQASRSQGFDCISLLLGMAAKMDLSVPDEFEGVTRETYPELWDTNKEKAKAVLFRFLSTLGKEITPAFAFTGDLLILKNRQTGTLTIGIHAGGDKIMSAFTDVGVKVIDLRLYKIKRAFRWRR